MFFCFAGQLCLTGHNRLVRRAQNEVNLLTSKLFPLLPPPKVRSIPVFQREMTIHILQKGAFVRWKEQQGPSLSVFHTGYFRLFHLFYTSFPSKMKSCFERMEKWTGDVFWPHTGYNYDVPKRSWRWSKRTIPIRSHSLLTLRVCRWLANSIGTGFKKRYKPALCVLGSSTVYFYCT